MLCMTALVIFDKPLDQHTLDEPHKNNLEKRHCPLVEAMLEMRVIV
jgi:hypothetical protein